ncbi:ArsR/SmtB family transcription factor [Georgenia muralis]|uniref:DNA-binding transcriptional ArsR family regulator n=1 Tax=Georgenia muralis TaxID=154117 RepID=A0A3N4ZR39_9MICO|nr:metalloregulator ArsR/SmtB family transcription factor [Georgenia muralis]RPF28012.1 DNA-binding transcriptional ArsR family regulator [Georgenia muralis]
MGHVTPLDACAVVAVHPDKVALTQENIPDLSETARLAALFKLLGDPRRARILYALLEAGELCVCDLAASVEVPETAVSQSLRLLRTAGVVDNRRDGRMVYYRLADAHVRMLLDLSREHTRHEERP